MRNRIRPLLWGPNTAGCGSTAVSCGVVLIVIVEIELLSKSFL